MDNMKARYVRYVSMVRATLPHEEAMSVAVGGLAQAIGKIELALLRHYGLQASDYLIDVGCGSGRLAIPLSKAHGDRYLGTDLVPDLLENARNVTRRPAWRFEEVSGLSIPEADHQADMACFFSVFTHLLHEQTYLYLREAKRVLRPGGKVVFSFLEFGVGSNWQVFMDTVYRESIGRADDAVINVFINPGDIPLWAASLEMRVIDLRRGDDRFVPLTEPVTMEDGSVISGSAALGQSTCVLET
jgi:SAM-dependent methyltransferase